MLGKKLSPILCEMEATILDYEIENQQPPEYTDEAFRAASKIFMSALMDKMWQMQQAQNVHFSTRVKMAEKAGNELRKLCRTYTGIDTHQLYK